MLISAAAIRRVEELFAENFTERGELGASVSIWQDGREVVSLAGGFRDREKTQKWTAETKVLFWSATKGLSAACLLHACQENGITLSRRVAEFWPEFAQAGKERTTIAELLSHRAGVPALDRKVSALDHAAVAAAIAEQAPAWRVGEGHGYHPRTFGFAIDELLRRITQFSLRDYWRQHLAEPLELDVWIGMPPEIVEEASAVFAAKGAPPRTDPFYLAFMTPSSLTARAFASPHGLHSVSAMNASEARMASLGAFGGVGTAQGLGKFYAMLAWGGAWEGDRFFKAETLDAMSVTLSQATDRVLQIETAFSAGFMRDPLSADGRKLRHIFGPSLRAFGHPGAGGSHAFADPQNRIAFAYVMNQMEPGVLPNEKALRLTAALYAG